MRESVLVLNAGSSSIKFSVYETAADRSLRPGVHGEVEGIGSTPRLRALDAEGGKLADRAVPGTDQSSAMGLIHDWFSRHVGVEVNEEEPSTESVTAWSMAGQNFPLRFGSTTA